MPSYPSWEEMRRRKGRGESVQKGREEKWKKNGRRWRRGDGSGNDKVGKRMRRQERKGGGERELNYNSLSPPTVKQ